MDFSDYFMMCFFASECILRMELDSNSLLSGIEVSSFLFSLVLYICDLILIFLLCIYIYISKTIELNTI